jgi:hypothetical protein
MDEAQSAKPQLSPEAFTLRLAAIVLGVFALVILLIFRGPILHSARNSLLRLGGGQPEDETITAREQIVLTSTPWVAPAPSKHFPNSVRNAIDLDGDGRREFYRADRSEADGTWVSLVGTDGKERWRAPLPSSPRAIEYGDVDGDGRTDFVAATNNKAGTVLAISATGKQLFSESIGPLCMDALMVADADGDGGAEVIAITPVEHRFDDELYSYAKVSMDAYVIHVLHADGKPDTAIHIPGEPMRNGTVLLPWPDAKGAPHVICPGPTGGFRVYDTNGNLVTTYPYRMVGGAVHATTAVLRPGKPAYLVIEDISGNLLFFDQSHALACSVATSANPLGTDLHVVPSAVPGAEDIVINFREDKRIVRYSFAGVTPP